MEKDVKANPARKTGGKRITVGQRGRSEIAQIRGTRRNIYKIGKEGLYEGYGESEGIYEDWLRAIKLRQDAPEVLQALEEAREGVLKYANWLAEAVVEREKDVIDSPLDLQPKEGATRHIVGQESSSKEYQLNEKIRFLEQQLKSERPDRKLYRIGAGSFAFSSASLVIWGMTGIAAPLHPIFAAVVIPASIGVMGMAFLIRKYDGLKK